MKANYTCYRPGKPRPTFNKANRKTLILSMLLILFALSPHQILGTFKIVDETAHEVLVEQPDIVESISESEIVEDDHHNVEDVVGSQLEETVDDSNDNDDEYTQLERKTYQTADGEYVEETRDPTGTYYQKKVVKNGPGYQSVTITSNGGGGIIQLGGGGGGDMLEGLLSMFQQMAMIDQMLQGLVPDFPDPDPADPNADNSHALVPSSGFLSHDETPPAPEPVAKESKQTEEKQDEYNSTKPRSLIEKQSDEEAKAIAKKAKLDKKRRVVLIALSMLLILGCTLMGFILSCKLKGSKQKKEDEIDDSDSAAKVVMPEIPQKRGLGKSD
ncbi:hypothetical protein FGO68_gene12812 [Halteria grandinella]|uniref:Uncharacterized protein n=1 Tax=Halteria grandinella TaxID=5974 RepID=A0A8J8T390_HALGN|nr:hypothetical protein FGO68_gene12812 [Halteria grandinella]